MNAYLSDQPVRLSPLRDEQGNQPRFGLLLEPGRPGMHVGELPAQWLKGLARSHHLLLLRGFAAFADAESLTRYCHDVGEVMLWPFGAVLELVEQEGAEDHIFANNYVPLHWDGMYLETVPEFQVFHCVDAPGDSDGGRTTFSSTPAALQLADSSELELWRRASGRYQRSAAHYSSRSAAPIVERHPRREFPSCVSANRRSRATPASSTPPSSTTTASPRNSAANCSTACAAACTTHRRTTPTAGAATTW